MSFNALALFCSDIREEKGGTDTLVGVLPDNLNVPNVPGVTKLSIYLRMAFTPDEKIQNLSTKLTLPGGEILEIGEIDLEVVENARAKAEGLGSPLVGLITRIQFPQLIITSEGRMQFFVRKNDHEHLVSHLNIIIKSELADSKNVRELNITPKTLNQ